MYNIFDGTYSHSRSIRRLRARLVAAAKATSGGTYTGGRPGPRGIAVTEWGWRLDPVRVSGGKRK